MDLPEPSPWDGSNAGTRSRTRLVGESFSSSLVSIMTLCLDGRSTELSASVLDDAEEDDSMVGL